MDPLVPGFTASETDVASKPRFAAVLEKTCVENMLNLNA